MTLLDLASLLSSARVLPQGVSSPWAPRGGRSMRRSYSACVRVSRTVSRAWHCVAGRKQPPRPSARVGGRRGGPALISGLLIKVKERAGSPPQVAPQVLPREPNLLA